jgi:hypothetical protein
MPKQAGLRDGDRAARGKLPSRHHFPLRKSAPPRQAPRLTLRAAYFSFGLVAAATLSGCPGGAELENPDQNMQYFSGAPGVGGATGGAGATQGGAAGAAAGGAGLAGSAGTGAVTGTWKCTDVLLVDALKNNCVSGCHVGNNPGAGLTLNDPAAIHAQMVNKPATFSDFSCDPVGVPFRECTQEELPGRGCPIGAKLIDSENFDNSWVVKKLKGEQGACGSAMPIAPGNSLQKGWDVEGRRRQCYVEFFRSLAGAQ